MPHWTNIWKSTNGGASFPYLGQAEGAQAASAIARGGGAGGGDEDIAIGASGNVYVNSLWLGSCTQSSSFNGGGGGAPQPLPPACPGGHPPTSFPPPKQQIFSTLKQPRRALARPGGIFG